MVSLMFLLGVPVFRSQYGLKDKGLIRAGLRFFSRSYCLNCFNEPTCPNLHNKEMDRTRVCG